MCFNHYWVTVAATEKVTSSWLCFRLWNTFSCTVPFFLSLLCEELLSCHIHIYCFPGNCCSQSEEYHVREMKGDICWQFSTEVWLFSTIPSLSQRGMHTVVKECSESPSDHQAMGAQLLASPSAPVCAILGLTPCSWLWFDVPAAKVTIYKSISLLCWGLPLICLLMLICFLGSAPLKTLILLFLNPQGKTGIRKNKGVWGWVFFLVLLAIWKCGETELHISSHDSEEYGEIPW